MKAIWMMLALVVAFGFVSNQGFAKGKDGQMMAEPSKDDRAKMATMHEEMAACLKSDKKFSECHEAMMKQCPMMKDGKQCPMMMHHGHGMKKEGGKASDEHAHH